jgi:hypothetical protein
MSRFVIVILMFRDPQAYQSYLNHEMSCRNGMNLQFHVETARGTIFTKEQRYKLNTKLPSKLAQAATCDVY